PSPRWGEGAHRVRGAVGGYLACAGGGAVDRGGGLAEQDRAVLRGAEASLIRVDRLRLLVGALDRRSRLDRLEPALDVGKILELLALALVRHDPGIDRHVGDGIVSG